MIIMLSRREVYGVPQALQPFEGSIYLNLIRLGISPSHDTTIHLYLIFQRNVYQGLYLTQGCLSRPCLWLRRPLATRHNTGVARRWKGGCTQWGGVPRYTQHHEWIFSFIDWIRWGYLGQLHRCQVHTSELYYLHISWCLPSKVWSPSVTI